MEQDSIGYARFVFTREWLKSDQVEDREAYIKRRCGEEGIRYITPEPIAERSSAIFTKSARMFPVKVR